MSFILTWATDQDRVAKKKTNNNRSFFLIIADLLKSLERRQKRNTQIRKSRPHKLRIEGTTCNLNATDRHAGNFIAS